MRRGPQGHALLLWSRAQGHHLWGELTLLARLQSQPGVGSGISAGSHLSIPPSRLWRVPWTARRSNQSILKEINSEYSLEGLMRKLKLQSFGHLMRRANSLEKTLMLGKIEGRGEGDDRG